MTALLGLILLAALLLIAHRSASGLRRQAALTGWALAGLFLFLGLFNARKKLAMIPLGSAHFWLRLHVTGGMTALLLFWLPSPPFSNSEFLCKDRFHLQGILLATTSLAVCRLK